MKLSTRQNIRYILTFCLLLTTLTIGAQTSVYHLKDGRILENVKSVTRDQQKYIFRYNHTTACDSVTVSDVCLIETSIDNRANPTEGLDDLLYMKDGNKYRGRIVKQIPGVSFTLRRTGSGILMELPADQLRCAKKVRRNLDKDYWEQRPYDNVVETQYATYRGIIIEQNLGEDTANPDDDFIVIFTEDYQMTKTIRTSDIRRLTTRYRQQQENK